MRLGELEREVERLKTLTKKIEPDEHKGHLWSEWRGDAPPRSHVQVRFCTHPACLETEYCGTQDRPHKLTLHAGVEYFPPDMCEVCRYRDI